MKVSIKSYVKPEQVAAILSKLCEKYNVDIRSMDLYIRFDKDKEKAEAYAAGTTKEVQYIIQDIYKLSVDEINIPDGLEILSTSEVKEIERQRAEARARREKEQEEHWKRFEMEKAKGFIGVVQRDEHYRFLIRKELQLNKLVLPGNDKLLFVYYVADREKVKKELSKKYAEKITGEKKQNALFTFSDSDIKEIEDYLKSIEIDAVSIK